MWFSPPWLASLFDSAGRIGPRLPARRRGQSRPRSRPIQDRSPLEALEDRCLLSFNPVTSPSVDSSPLDVANADFNGDGKLDVVTLNAGGGASTVSALLGNGQGGFATASNSAAGANAVSLSVGDLNADGKMDLAIAAGDDGVQLLFGKGDGTFQEPFNIPVSGVHSLSVAVGDFNNDGKIDLAVGSAYYVSYPYYYYGYGYTQGSVNVLMGTGEGRFSEPIVYYTGGGSPLGLSAGDLNGDGIDDIATAEEYGTVTVLTGGDNVLPTYAGPVYQSWYLRDVKIGDFTGDGIPDLAVAGEGLHILTGIGGGAFGTSHQRTIAADGGLAVADFNGDGKLDAATASLWSSTLSVFLGRGDGSLTPPVNYAVGTNPVSVATGDFNQDGRPDLTVANSGSDTVSVMINNGAWPSFDAPSLKISDATVKEGNVGNVNISFTVTLSAASSQDVTVRFNTAGGSATAGSDFQARTGEVTILAGQTSATIVIPVVGDRTPELSESFYVNLVDAVNAFVDDGLAVATIADDEPRIRISDAAQYEGNGKGTTWFKFTITLSVAYDQPVTVHFATANGTAASGSDYLAQSSSITFAPGETTKTISIAVTPDKTKESNETFYVELSAASSNAEIERARALGTIWDDDRGNGGGRKK